MPDPSAHCAKRGQLPNCVSAAESGYWFEPPGVGPLTRVIPKPVDPHRWAAAGVLGADFFVDSVDVAVGSGMRFSMAWRRDDSMKDTEEEHAREILREAFTAGWQAALAVNVTNPRVLAVIESCFEQWLQEAADEAEVLGLLFWGREDLPRPALRSAPAGVGYAAEAWGGPQNPYLGRGSGGPSDIARTDGQDAQASKLRYDGCVIGLGPAGDETDPGSTGRARGRRGRRVLEILEVLRHDPDHRVRSIVPTKRSWARAHPDDTQRVGALENTSTAARKQRSDSASNQGSPHQD
jgi:hypothetical protein